MNRLNTTSVSLAVTPTVVSTLFSHAPDLSLTRGASSYTADDCDIIQYLNRKSTKERPTAHLSYDEGLHLVRAFLDFASHHTVEELQAFTAQWVPHPQWVKVDTVTIAAEHLTRAAELLQEQLGPEGIREVGGRKWWQWRKPNTQMEAEWIEMRSDANERKKSGKPLRRVMMYVHGGAYFFGSVDEHRYQMQRHARKLQARVLAPKYRLAPSFPFPCGLQDCLASYLFLLTVQDPSTIVLAGDSAGGGMVLSLLCILRDQGIPLPAGAILISPWVDLTHSFPSVAGEAPFDYIPQSGFHHKPSRAWPPPNEDDINMLVEEAAKRKRGKTSNIPDTAQLKEKQQAPVVNKSDNTNEEQQRPEFESAGIMSDPENFLTVTIGGEVVTVKDQIQMYTTNSLLNHPLVSPIMQPTLGGLPPLLIVVGGGEILRDEQIHMAHKCANPSKYAPPPEALTEKGKMLLDKYKPTDVQLQVWDDLCHVATTLSFTIPAKYMYRSISQFGAWALARAQQRGIEILDDDQISIISGSGSDAENAEQPASSQEQEKKGPEQAGTTERKKNSKETQQQDYNVTQGRVGRAGDPLPSFSNHMIRQRVTRKGVILPLAPEDELPACRMNRSEIGVIKEVPVKKWLDTKKQWDERYAATKARIHKKIIEDMTAGLQDFGPGEHPPPSALAGRWRLDANIKEKKRTKSVGLALWSLWGSKHDEMTVEREQKAEKAPETHAVQPEEGGGARDFADIEKQGLHPVTSAQSRSPSRRRLVTDENQTGSIVADENTSVAKLLELRRQNEPDLLSPTYMPQMGAAGKRPFIDGIAMPFSLNKDADTASMMTLNSAASPMPGSRPTSPMLAQETQPLQPLHVEDEKMNNEKETPAEDQARPGIETFVTAHEDLPRANNQDTKESEAKAA
ncbi:hypothetical protein S7711_05202 [Stachybotrys chartarum IBT 7711]|uniref:Alpha/beta hydrolase fold-3 domain-containing protein n=1 Tax=Stachybotrys chartarum (strain CBS 109288 / IBT 7711) TaxID=1280523 RepID=A0A084ANG9_STACB|nr:hypothetical protein S7711_05202 [Stachybotrys chartarum IBT 7711]